MSDEPAESGGGADPEEPQDGPDERSPADDASASPSASDDAPSIETDGEGVVGDRHDPEPAYPEPDGDVGGISTPPDDEEMPLADHIEEMVLRLAVVLLFGAGGTAIGLLWASQAIEFVWFNVFPYAASEVPLPHVYHPLELWLTRIKISSLLGIMVALPAFVYECYLFMRPGLYPNERKYYLAAVPTSVVLAAVGMLFSYVLVLPILFQYFTYYAEGSADIAYALGETFNLIITLTGFLAIVFQIPLFIMLAIMMGVTTRRWLAQKRLYFWAAFAGLSFMFTIDPTMMAPVLVAVTMILLFEGTLFVLKWVGRE
jgi:sec-independent protein translocase protein TatC